jgi:hypothetical protein
LLPAEEGSGEIEDESEDESVRAAKPVAPVAAALVMLESVCAVLPPVVLKLANLLANS